MTNAICAACPVGTASLGRCPLVRRERPAGAWIYTEGETADRIWFLQRGRVALCRAAQHDRTVAVRSEGAFLGLEALIRPTYHDGARALTDVTICGTTRDRFDAWLGPPGTPARTALEQTLAAAHADEPRGAGPDGTSVRRVARWLLDRPEPQAAIPRRVTASLLGMVPETFSRALSRLAALGAIELTRRSLRIRDRAVLASIYSSGVNSGSPSSETP